MKLVPFMYTGAGSQAQKKVQFLAVSSIFVSAWDSMHVQLCQGVANNSQINAVQALHFHFDFWSVFIIHKLLRASVHVAPEILQNLLFNRSTISCWLRAPPLKSFATTPFIQILHSPDFQAEQISISDTPTLSAYTIIKLPSWAHTFDSTGSTLQLSFLSLPRTSSPDPTHAEKALQAPVLCC